MILNNLFKIYRIFFYFKYLFYRLYLDNKMVKHLILLNFFIYDNVLIFLFINAYITYFFY